MNKSMKVTTKSVSQKKRKQKGNKAKEVEFWEDIDGKNSKTTNNSSPPSETGENKQNKLKGKWICGTIPQSEINKMPWGLLDELTDEEYGYYCEG